MQLGWSSPYQHSGGSARQQAGSQPASQAAHPTLMRSVRCQQGCVVRRASTIASIHSALSSGASTLWIASKCESEGSVQVWLAEE